MASIHENARDFYTEEQLNAWAPTDYDEQGWKSRLCAMRPFIALVEGQPVGYADLQESGYIDHFYVSGDASGRGIGSLLMRHIHEVAAMRGLLRLSAHVSLSGRGILWQSWLSD